MSQTAAQRFLLDGIGLFAHMRSQPLRVPGAVLLLDRDGVVNADVGYVGEPDRVTLLPGVAAAVCACNRAGIPVALVTNQSGIGRGYYDWSGFMAVQSVIDATLARDGASLDAVFACGYCLGGIGSLGIADHPWRKPRPGMLNAALDLLNADRTVSAMVGDQESDMAAAAAACIGRRFLVNVAGQAGTLSTAVDRLLVLARPCATKVLEPAARAGA